MKYLRSAIALTFPLLFIPSAFAQANMLQEGVPWYVLAALFGSIIFVPTALNATVEAVVGFAYVMHTKKPKSVLLWQLLANIVTFIPFFIYFADGAGNVLSLTIAEILIILVETCIIRAGAHRVMRWGDALLLSLLANITTIALSLFLLLYFK